MALLAVDIVLLPPDELVGVAISLNQKLLANNPPKIKLGRESSMPHISLAMGCLDENDLDKAGTLLKGIAKDFPPIDLKVPSVGSHASSNGEKTSSLEFLHHPILQYLHEAIVKQFNGLLSDGAEAKMFFGGAEVSESSFTWVDNYLKNHCYENFWPHLTLGQGEIDLEGPPKVYRVKKLAICHLGNHCTCQKILTLAELSKAEG